MYPFKYQVLQQILREWRIYPYEFKHNAKRGYYHDDFLTIEKEENDKLHLKLVYTWNRDEDNLDKYGYILRDKGITIRFILHSHDYPEYDRPMVELWEDWGEFPLMPEEVNEFIECSLFHDFYDKNGKMFKDIKAVLKSERREKEIDWILCN
jgi:hypothetical protein